MLREYAEGIPSGLIACRLGKTCVHILGISPRSILVRTASALPFEPITLYFYQVESGCYCSHTLSSYETGEVRRENGAVLSRFFFDDPVCARLIRKALNEFARYVEIRSTYGASAYGQEITGYPLEDDDIFPASLEDARRDWFSKLPPLRPGRNCSLAVSLNCRDLWMLYLKTPVSGFMNAYAELRGIPRWILPEHSPDRLYIGNEYCRLVFPEAELLEKLLCKVRQENLAVTLVTAELRTGEEARADALFKLAAEYKLEVEINDWGMLHRAQAFKGRFPVLLGTQLNRRRKDPRLQWKTGFSSRKELLGQNALNDSSYRKFLEELGICRFEYESCGIAASLPDSPCSLHLPFYQTNTSLWCPLSAICLEDDRGKQGPVSACAHWCENNTLLYPDHLHMLGRWNSLLALDCTPADNSDGYDRWVLNF